MEKLTEYYEELGYSKSEAQRIAFEILNDEEDKA